MQLPKQYVPKEAERKWRARWDEMAIHRWDPARGRNETFSVDIPPPIHTAAWPTVEELAEVALPIEEDPYGAAVEVLFEVRRIKSEAKVSVKAPLKSLEITGSAKALNALRCVLGDLLAVTNARTAVFNEGLVAGGRFKVQAILAS